MRQPKVMPDGSLNMRVAKKVWFPPKGVTGDIWFTHPAAPREVLLCAREKCLKHGENLVEPYGLVCGSNILVGQDKDGMLLMTVALHKRQTDAEELYKPVCMSEALALVRAGHLGLCLIASKGEHLEFKRR